MADAKNAAPSAPDRSGVHRSRSHAPTPDARALHTSSRHNANVRGVRTTRYGVTYGDKATASRSPTAAMRTSRTERSYVVSGFSRTIRISSAAQASTLHHGA